MTVAAAWGRAVVASLAITFVAGGLLLALGRTPWCTCGSIRLWTSDAWGPENSQQLFDPYSFTHISHGVLLYALVRRLAAKVSLPGRVVLAIAVEAIWEVFENTPLVIDRYRATTMALGYYGDSVLNSIGDIGACALGITVAALLPVRATVAAVVLLELALAFSIRDGLILNIVMLGYPLAAVKDWQAGV